METTSVVFGGFHARHVSELEGSSGTPHLGVRESRRSTSVASEFLDINGLLQVALCDEEAVAWANSQQLEVRICGHIGYNILTMIIGHIHRVRLNRFNVPLLNFFVFFLKAINFIWLADRCATPSV